MGEALFLFRLIFWEISSYSEPLKSLSRNRPDSFSCSFDIVGVRIPYHFHRKYDFRVAGVIYPLEMRRSITEKRRIKEKIS